MSLSRSFIVVVMLFCSFALRSQSNLNPMMLNGEEKAYMYHVVMRSNILKNHISKYFHYKGEMVLLNDGRPNYDSIESIIILQPHLLIVETQDLSRQSKGLLAELATKMALWKLNKALHYGNTGNKEYEHLNLVYEEYMSLVMEDLPPNALKIKKEEVQVNKKIEALSNPMLSLSQKIALISGNTGLSVLDVKQIIDAFSHATNLWVEKESLKIFNQIGGKADTYNNILIAAGDGSMTSGLLDANEKDYKGRFERGLPKAVGLFTYQLKLEKNDRGSEEVKPSFTPMHEFETVLSPDQTNLHFSVWGFNAIMQTTVSIQKGEKSYLLYGSEKSKLLSPDSTFGEGKTYHRHIEELENEIIADLKEKIYGKKGFEFMIDERQEKLDATLMEIKQTELTLSEQRKKGAAPAKRIKKKRKKTQNRLIYLYERKEQLEKEIKELKLAWEEAMGKLHYLETQLDVMKGNLGYVWMDYTEKDSIYTFTDGSVFNMRTQDFSFPQTDYPEKFTIRVIAIGHSPFASQVDEVQLHVNITNVAYKEKLLFDLSLEDVFDSDSFVLQENLVTENDSTRIKDLFSGILQKNLTFDLNGYGIGKIVNGELVRDSLQSQLSNYSEKQSKEYFKDLRKTLLWVEDNEAQIQINIASFCDPVKSNISISHKMIQKLQEKNPALSGNELLSGLRSLTVYHKLIDELNGFAGKMLEREDAIKVINILEESRKRVAVKIGAEELNYRDVSDIF